ncbi:hypothetical protein C8F01DRAFT_1206491 [Mycena amicta]|nr:hypothetical protein C8F01DRAFT_1206491 [Mycena amicta]
MSAPQKLTKRQKKSLAYYRKGKDGTSLEDVEGNELPLLEVQDQADSDANPLALAMETQPDSSLVQAGSTARKGQAKAKDTGPSTTEKKRKRDSAAVPDGAEPKRKKTKTPGETEGGPERDEKGKGNVKQRYILFVGEYRCLAFPTALKPLFQAISNPPPTVRLRTPKPASGKPTVKSKGCAFVEFTHRNALQQGLKLHQSELEGRRINVELTVGGGGKGDARIQKLKDRNKSLHGERKDRLEKLAQTDPTLGATPERPQRFSATSGLEQTPLKRRTWTIGDADDDEMHRGGKRHTKARKKQWGTGVNAIPVG